MVFTNIANHLQTITMRRLFVGFPDWDDTQDCLEMPLQL